MNPKTRWYEKAGTFTGANALVKLSDGKVELCGSSDSPFGVGLTDSYNETTEKNILKVVITPAQVKLVADGVIVKGDILYTSANGKVIASDNPNISVEVWNVGKALSNAEDGEIVDVLTNFNFKNEIIT